MLWCYGDSMPRLTITLSAERHRALKEAAARRGKTIGQLIEQSLELAGIKTRDSARQILQKARKHGGLREREALSLAVRETRSHRRRK